MDDLLVDLIRYALSKQASDIHFVKEKKSLQIEFRTQFGMIPLYQDIWKPAFFEYLKFLAKMDLANPYVPQSGQFKLCIDNQNIFCRFSVLHNQKIETGVLRLLNTRHAIELKDLSKWERDTSFFESLVHLRQGLIISVGPTNSGKTTTLHALLHEIAKMKEHKIVSLEDPIEIEDSTYLQLQINESMGFNYEVGIEQLLRHDPDVICIGETRNSYTAKMVLRAALTGHLVLTSIHAKNAKECLDRLTDLGISEYELKNVVSAIFAQRLYASKTGKVCVYEIMEKKDIEYVIENKKYPTSFVTLAQKIEEGIKKGYIFDKQAEYDMLNING